MQLGWAVIVLHILTWPAATAPRPADIVQQLPTVYAEKKQCEIVRAHVESTMLRAENGRLTGTVFCAHVYADQPVAR